MIENITADAIETQVAENIATAEDAAREEITGILDGLGSLKKVKSLTDAARAAAEAPLREALAEAIARVGQPVARGNTLFLTVDGALLTVDLTPKTLVRL